MHSQAKMKNQPRFKHGSKRPFQQLECGPNFVYIIQFKVNKREQIPSLSPNDCTDHLLTPKTPTANESHLAFAFAFALHKSVKEKALPLMSAKKFTLLVLLIFSPLFLVIYVSLKLKKNYAGQPALHHLIIVVYFTFPIFNYQFFYSSQPNEMYFLQY